ncbi:MAG: GGDEF domain-containing protein [bacterium JZ-2024 1]
MASEIEDFLLHHPEVAFIEMDPAGTIQRIGAGLVKTLGIPTEMYLGRPLDDLMKVEDVSRVKEAIRGNLPSIILTLKNPGQPREGTYLFWIYRTSAGGRVLFGVLVPEVLKSLPLDTLRLMMEIDRLTREVHHLRTALEERSRRLEQMSVMDPLTGAYNRRYFLTLLETEWSRAVRYQYPFSLMGFDIDDFREVNERAGPDIGDSVLIDVTKAVRANLRISDLLGRYEGAIFMALLPHNNAGRAYALADRLCEIIRGLPFFDLDGKPFHITASFGISEAFAGPGDSATHLVRRSLRALKQAKARGKNRVEIAHGL